MSRKKRKTASRARRRAAFRMASALLLGAVLLGCIAAYRTYGPPLPPERALPAPDAEAASAAAPGRPAEAPRNAPPAEAPQAAPRPHTEALEIPLCPATLAGENGGDHEVHAYRGFTLCYRESYEEAEWVAYVLTREELGRVTGRTNDFRADTGITTGSATPADYRGSGYDRGHLAPAADMEWSERTAHESFLMSNMAPQAPALNRGLWKALEEQVRRWADAFGAVTVVTGPVLEREAAAYPAIGGNGVAVPEYFYKALLAQFPDGRGGTASAAIAFIMPNGRCGGTIWDYAASIDDLEERTGLDFFSLLPDDIEDAIEGTKEPDVWMTYSQQ